MLTHLRQLPGIADTLARRITQHLGRGNEQRAIQAIEQSPYILMEVPRIGFKIADRVAREYFKVHPGSPLRHEHGNRHILGEDGSMAEREFDAARIKLDLIDPALRRYHVVEESGRVWLPEVLEAEQQFASWVAALPLGQPLTALEDRHPDLRDDLDDAQWQATTQAVYGPRILSITGGAGTGKTKVIGGIARLARRAGRMTAVAAFAGKAADRIRESLVAARAVTGYAGTIHKLLSYNGSSFQAGLLEFDLIILDEASMIPTMLLWEVVKRLRPGATLVLVGDQGQLPPVGYGQPFADLITLGIPEIHLEVNYRSAHVQGIIRTANAIRSGQVLQDAGDNSLELWAATDLSEVVGRVIDEMKGQNHDRWQLITWKNDDAMAFNLAAQDELNPDGYPLFTVRVFGQDVSSLEVRSGDKVMVKSNAYEYGVFNGQLGTAIDTRTVETDTTRVPEDLTEWADAEPDGLIHERKTQLCVRVQIGSEIVNIPLDEAHELLTLGYAITVHKAQGSDWDTVIIYQPGAVQFDAQRWWYTSVTRARTRCIVCYEVKVKGGGDAMPLWWANTRKTQELGPSIFVGRVKRAIVEGLDMGGPWKTAMGLSLGTHSPEELDSSIKRTWGQ
jgi:exodeoxyribonuclease V alpha subunit